MNTNAKFSGLVSELNELVETGLVEIKVTRSTSTGYGLGSLEAALQKQVEVQTVHTLSTSSEDEVKYVKCTKATNGAPFHNVDEVYKVVQLTPAQYSDNEDLVDLEIENKGGFRNCVANVNLNEDMPMNWINYAPATEKEFLGEDDDTVKLANDTDEPEDAQPIKRIIFTIMGLDTEQTLQRKIEICKQRIHEIENPDPIQALRNSDTLIDCMDGWYGTGK